MPIKCQKHVAQKVSKGVSKKKVKRNFRKKWQKISQKICRKQGEELFSKVKRNATKCQNMLERMSDDFLKNKSSIFARKTVKTIARKKWDHCFRSGKINASCMLAGLDWQNWFGNNSCPTIVVILALLSHCGKTRRLLCRLAGKAQRMRRHPTLAVAQARQCEATLETCPFLR